MSQSRRATARAVHRLTREEPLRPVSELCREVGAELGDRRGRASRGAVERWIFDGVTGADGKRHYLDGVKRNGVWHTSRAAIGRFKVAVCRPAAEGETPGGGCRLVSSVGGMGER